MKDYELKKNDYPDVSLAGLDHYIGPLCGGNEPLCGLLEQLEYEPKRGGFRIGSQ